MNFVKVFFVGIILSITGFANAGVITGKLNVDNQNWVYLSTDDNLQGDFLSSGTNWTVTDYFNGNLTAGTDYFLHVKAEDVGGIAGFLGEFSLTGNDHVFSNGLVEILTNTTDWNVSTTGWNNYVAATMVNGTNGVLPWGTRPAINQNAAWIWSSNAHNDNNTYFSLAITATNVPEPSTMLVFVLGMIALVSRQFKKKY
jgi:MSHA biogenesis protein MshQ